MIFNDLSSQQAHSRAFLKFNFLFHGNTANAKLWFFDMSKNIDKDLSGFIMETQLLSGLDVIVLSCEPFLQLCDSYH